MKKEKDDFEQWVLLLKEAKSLGMTVKEIKEWFTERKVSKKEVG
jgi:hypothetical protein